MFGKKITTTPSLLQRSADIISMFTKTVDGLTQINNEITQRNEEIKSIVDSLKDEQNTLDDQKSTNEKIIANIKKLL